MKSFEREVLKMKKYHVEILSPVEIIAEGIPARSGSAAIERVLKNAGYANIRFCWHQGAPVTAPPGKRPTCPVYSDGSQFLHTIAWTE
jgi:hypothetical protein